ncbi:MAG: ATP-binding protein [Bacteroidota bacterium]
MPTHTLSEFFQNHPYKGFVVMETGRPVDADDLAESDNALQDMLDHLFVTDTNDRALELLNREKTVIGSSAQTIFGPQYHANSDRLLEIFKSQVNSGELVFIKEDGTQFSLHSETINLYQNGLFKGLYLFLEKLNKQKELLIGLRKRDELLSATARVNHTLLSDDSIDEGVYNALDIIGRATAVDRVYVFENYIEESTGKYLCNQRIEWAKDSITPQIDNEDLQNFPLSDITPRWVEYMLEGKAINGLVKQFPKGEREILEPQNIVSILVVPILIKDKFWGFVGFDNCRSEYKWSDTEVGVLTSLASNIGLAYERIRTKQELMESQNMFNQIANTIDEVFYITDPDQNLLFMNKAFERIFGIPIDNVMQDPNEFRQHVHKDDLSKLEFGQNLETDFTEVRYLDPDTGNTRFISNKRFPVYNEEGEIIRYTGVLNDTTSERVAQKNLEKTLEAEKELNELKNRFIAMISHEIRTPITTIVSSIDLIETHSARLNEKKKKQINSRMMGASNRIIELIEEVLLMGKANAGKMYAEYSKVDIYALIHSIVENQKTGSLKHRKVDISLDLQKETILSDQRLLSHILNNLLSNAGKYSSAESTVKLSLSESDNNMILTVEDEGIGIDHSYQKRIFEPFFRAREVVDIEGTGLGLPIVKGSVEAMNGSVEVESNKNKGSIFKVLLPIKR